MCLKWGLPADGAMKGAQLLGLLVTLVLNKNFCCGYSSLECGNEYLTATSDILSSPGYPNSYLPHTDCTWQVLLPGNQDFAIKFVDLDIEEDESCMKAECCDHVWVSVNSERMCGHNRTFSYSLPRTDNVAIIKFHSSKIREGGRGFQAIYLICRSDQFRCADNLKCIDRMSHCDGFKDCDDGSDEHSCHHPKKNHYRLDGCSGKNMVPCGGSDSNCYNNNTDRCNGIANCRSNGTDEMNCGACGADRLPCRSVGCYPIDGACDSIEHCAGGWDEGIKGGCGICDQESIPCSFRDNCHCFSKTERCNRIIDCPSGEDELSCVAECKDKIACDRLPGCYSPSERCDGIPQCADESDEFNCGTFLVKFRCTSTPRCVDDSMVCDGVDDCGDGSDEADCVRNSVIAAVIMGSIACGLIAILGVAMGLRYYEARNRSSSNSSHGILSHRADDVEPLDEGILSNIYREPPPSYQEAIMQGAAPPMYWQPTRMINMSTNREVPPVTIHRPRPRSSITRPRPSRRVLKWTENLKPFSDELSSVSSENVIANDQLYPDEAGQTDSDTPMLELSDSHCADPPSESSSPSGTSTAPDQTDSYPTTN